MAHGQRIALQHVRSSWTGTGYISSVGRWTPPPLSHQGSLSVSLDASSFILLVECSFFLLLCLGLPSFFCRPCLWTGHSAPLLDPSLILWGRSLSGQKCPVEGVR